MVLAFHAAQSLSWQLASVLVVWTTGIAYRKGHGCVPMKSYLYTSIEPYPGQTLPATD